MNYGDFHVYKMNYYFVSLTDQGEENRENSNKEYILTGIKNDV